MKKEYDKYFGIFELSENDEINKDIILFKYRELAKKYHPDVNNNSSDEKMKLLNEAREFFMSHIVEFESSKSDYQYDNNEINDLFDKCKEFEDKISPTESVVVDEKTYKIDFRSLYKIIGRSVIYSLKEYGVSDDLLFLYGSIIVEHYIIYISKNPVIFLCAILEFLVELVRYFRYSDEEIVLSLKENEVGNLDWKNRTLCTLSIIVSTLSENEISLNNIISPIEKQRSTDSASDKYSRLIREYFIESTIARLIEFKFKKFYLEKKDNHIIIDGVKHDEKPNTMIGILEYNIKDYQATLAFFSPNFLNYYDDDNRIISEIKKTFISSLRDGTVGSFNYVDLFIMIRELMVSIYSDDSLNIPTIAKVIGAAYSAEVTLYQYCLAVGMPKDLPVDYKVEGMSLYDDVLHLVRYVNVITEKMVDIRLFDLEIEFIKEVYLKICDVHHLATIGKTFNDSKYQYDFFQKHYESYKAYNNISTEKRGCYVATCVYGSYDCPEVWRLRRYRDYYLDKSLFGRLFIKIYYLISPILIKMFGNKWWFKKSMKRILDNKIKKLKIKGYDDTPYNDKY